MQEKQERMFMAGATMVTFVIVVGGIAAIAAMLILNADMPTQAFIAALAVVLAAAAAMVTYFVTNGWRLAEEERKDLAEEFEAEFCLEPVLWEALSRYARGRTFSQDWERWSEALAALVTHFLVGGGDPTTGKFAEIVTRVTERVRQRHCRTLQEPKFLVGPPVGGFFFKDQLRALEILFRGGPKGDILAKGRAKALS